LLDDQEGKEEQEEEVGQGSEELEDWSLKLYDKITWTSQIRARIVGL
jgi:hypothetical protein